MYLPKFKYKGNLFTPGGEYALKATGDEYKGYYFKTYKGEFYTGFAPSLKDTNQQLLPLQETEREFGTLQSDEILLYDEIYNNPHEFSLKLTQEVPSYTPVIKVADSINGFIIRYFAQNKITKQIQEIEKTVYTDLDSKSVKYFYKNYSIVRLYWFLAGEIEDTQPGAYKIPGIRTKNTESIKAAEKVIPGLSQYLTNPLEFVQ